MSVVDIGSMDEVTAAGDIGWADVDAFHPPLAMPENEDLVSVLPGLAYERVYVL